MAIEASLARLRRVAACAAVLLAAAPAAAQTVPGVSAQAAPAEVDAPEPADAPPSFTLGAGLAFGVLNLPNFGVGAALLAQLRPAGFIPVELEAMYFFENENALSRGELDLRVHPLVTLPFPPGGARTDYRTAELRAALCPVEQALRSGELLACGGVSGGVLLARSEGLLDGKNETRPLFAFELYARWHFRLIERMGLAYSAGLFVPLVRERFGHVDSRGAFREQFQIAPVGGRLDLTLSYAF